MSLNVGDTGHDFANAFIIMRGQCLEANRPPSFCLVDKTIRRPRVGVSRSEFHNLRRIRSYRGKLVN